jgi:endonuclease/exonuclease/phosphatase family metal-dependent hydrolase
MRLASFNVENLFARAAVLGEAHRGVARATLDRFAAFNDMIGLPSYGPADKARMIAALQALGLERSDESPLVRLRQNRGRFVVRRRTGGMEIVANGRGDWAGWLELERDPVDDTAMRMTAQVIRDLGADVLGVVEAESRPALKAFSDEVLPLVGGAPYAHCMLIDGNDRRGIDCALMTRAGYPIQAMASHVDEADEAGPVFSRDCPEFHVETPGGARFIVLVNHFKSKIGVQRESDARRRRQAAAVAAIYEGLRRAGQSRIAVVGDLNDTPPEAAADPLAPLLRGTDLKDVALLPGHDHGGRPGTYGGSTAANKIDYILLSPALFGVAKASGIFRRGMWPGVRPRKWDVYPELDPARGGREVHAASDHGALWVDLDLD